MDMSKWVIAAKWYWCQIIEHESCIGHKCIVFSKKFVVEKWNFAVPMLILTCQCLDFPVAFKMCRINNHNDVEQKLKEMTDSCRNKIEL